jgi:hypothetical protein
MLNRFAMILGCALALAACGGDEVTATPDASVAIADSGPTRRDASTSDAAVEPEGCRDPLPPIASSGITLPRCAAATRDTVSACTFPPAAQSDIDCVTDALEADSTAPFTQTAQGQTISINCAACINYDQIHCMQENGCAEEVADFVCCSAAGGECDAENMALITCVQSDAARSAKCLGFGATSATTSCFAPATPPPADGGVAVDAAVVAPDASEG